MPHPTQRPATFLYVYAYSLLLLGATLTIGGARLLLLGGSPYYFISGIAIAASALLLQIRRAESMLIYNLTALGTVAWSLWELGWDTWALLPRIAALAALGMGFQFQGIKSQLTRGRYNPSRRRMVAAGGAIILFGIACRALAPPHSSPDPMYQIGTSNHSYTITPARTSTNTEFGDWRHYGNDQGGTRFSELLQIDPENVIRLRLVWEYTGSDNIANQTTPLKIGRTLFVCTPNGAIALDAENGSSIWRSVIAGTRSTARCRGLAYYRSTSIQGNCAERIISTIVLKDPFDVRLIALDARDGSACSHFGIRGEVSLLTDLGSVPPGYYEVTSAPTIVHDKVVVGGRIMDFQYWGGPSGVVRAFDVLSGKLVWAWDMGDPSRTLAPLPGETYTHSTPNSWAPMSGDDELGLVYVPTGNATPDFFGGNRRAFDDRYSSSVVALDVTSGVPRWSFQTTHHDVWDYDVASQPSLVNFQSGKRLIRGLVQPTKRGEIFVLNRQNGEPLFPVTEIPAPQGTVPEERLAPTQPISPSLPSFRGRDLTESDMWGVTPLDELWCRIHFRAARYSGTLTPPAVGASIQSPSFFGGMNWGGMAIDTARGIGVVTTTYLPLHVQLISREQVTRLSIKRLVPGKGHPPVPLSDQLILDALNPFNSNVNLGLLMNPWRFGGPGDGTPYGSIAASFMSPLQIPCTKPPYGRLSAIDLKTGRLLWTQPFGTMRDAGPFGIPSRIPLPVGMSTNSGAVVTLGGLTFIGATMEKSFRAYETTSGKLLWEDRLPTPSDATPMTYLSLKSQRQFVIVTAGGKYIRAYALPDVPRNDGVSHSSKSRRAI